MSNLYLVLVHGDQSFAFQFGKHSIDVRGAQLHDIADTFLRQRHFKRVFRSTSNGLKAGQHL